MGLPIKLGPFEVNELPDTYSVPDNTTHNIVIERAVIREIIKELYPLVAHTIGNTYTNESVGAMADEVLLLSAYKNKSYWDQYGE